METGKKALMTVRINSKKELIQFWNGLMKLTYKEIEVLDTLIRCEGELCGTMNRKLACAALGFSRDVLNTYIQRLKRKRAISVKDRIYSLNSLYHDRGGMEIVFVRDAQK